MDLPLLKRKTIFVGWQALGHPDKWANGRVCYDDDECALEICPITATCENTPGSFICHCNDGFRKTSETSCVGENYYENHLIIYEKHVVIKFEIENKKP